MFDEFMIFLKSWVGIAAWALDSSAGTVHVKFMYLPADGVTSAGAEIVYGMTNARVNA